MAETGGEGGGGALRFSHRAEGHEGRYLVTSAADGADTLEVWCLAEEVGDEDDAGEGCPPWLLLPDPETGEELEPRTVRELVGLGFHLLQQGCAEELRLNGERVRPESMDQACGAEIGEEEIVEFDGLRLPLLYALRGGRPEVLGGAGREETSSFADLAGNACTVSRPGGPVPVLRLEAARQPMFLSRAMAARLVPLLVDFAQTGTLRPRPWAAGDRGPPPAAAG